MVEQYVFVDYVQLRHNLLSNVLPCRTRITGKTHAAAMNIKLVYLLQKSYVTSRVWLCFYTVIR